MTTDEQHKFYLERPTPTTELQINDAQFDYDKPQWYTPKNERSYNLGALEPWEVRWKPEPKTVPAWPPVKPYWVKFAGTDKIMATTGFWNDQVIIGGTWYPLHALEHGLWTDDLRADPVVWHPFTKEVE